MRKQYTRHPREKKYNNALDRNRTHKQKDNGGEPDYLREMISSIGNSRMQELFEGKTGTIPQGAGTIPQERKPEKLGQPRQPFPPIRAFLSPRIGVNVLPLSPCRDTTNKLSQTKNARATHGSNIIHLNGRYQPRDIEDQKPVLFYGFPFPVASLRSSPEVSEMTYLSKLDYTQKLEILEVVQGGWYYVRTGYKLYGYVAAHLINTDLPDSESKLYQVKPGDTAQTIVQDHYGKIADKWGMDERFYVNVLVYANYGDGIYKKDSKDSWKETIVKAGSYIWIPSPQYSSIIAGEVKSGSVSHDTYKVTKDITNFILSAGKAVSCLLGGISAGYLDSQFLGVKHDSLYYDMLSIASHPDLFKIGFAAGCLASVGQGILEIIAGIGGEVAGMALNLTGIGALVGVSVNVASTALIVHGATITLAGATLAGQTIRDIVFEMSSNGGGGSIRKTGDKTSRGREFTEHGAERANERGFSNNSIDSIIDNNMKKRVKQTDPITGDQTWRYQDKKGNTVITDINTSRIITVYEYGGY